MKYAIVVIFVFLSLGIFCQVNNNVVVRNNDLKNPFERKLRYDRDNHLTITVVGYKSSDLKVVVTDGVVTGAGDDKIIKMNQVKSTVLSVIAMKPKQDTLRKIVFNVMGMPDPTPSLAGKSSGTISVAEVLAAGEIVSTDQGPFIQGSKSEVVGFTLSVSKGFLVEEKSDSSKFTPEQISLINELKPGQKFFIDNILVKMEDGKIRPIGTISFKIK
ncbi:MAG: hypothetical protein CVU05_15485 [Bacteroidetes bacterium HGW-Bacteroidetes-21]|jgi:hypothetical protein|nr:MAG: hypothetical protein CVU05_15485 [Bacteroidetes bacterium HGW-Bacteroidetes-21]